MWPTTIMKQDIFLSPEAIADFGDPCGLKRMCAITSNAFSSSTSEWMPAWYSTSSAGWVGETPMTCMKCGAVMWTPGTIASESFTMSQRKASWKLITRTVPLRVGLMRPKKSKKDESPKNTATDVHLIAQSSLHETLVMIGDTVMSTASKPNKKNWRMAWGPYAN